MFCYLSSLFCDLPIYLFSKILWFPFGVFGRENAALFTFCLILHLSSWLFPAGQNLNSTDKFNPMTPLTDF